MTPQLAVTVDVDGEAGLPHGGIDHAQRLSSRSERLYGIQRGLPRLLQLLAEQGAHGTFFIPGVTAGRHPAAVEAIVTGGHELGLHGHSHRRLDGMTAAEQRDDLERGLAAFAAAGLPTPAGYRAPAWELTPVTLELLRSSGFLYDSSLMGDDRPYRVGELAEIPVHWSLDDAPHYANGGSVAQLAEVWRAELRAAEEECRPLVVTLHPEISGRPHRLQLLRDLMSERPCQCVTLTALARESAHVGDELGE